MCDTFLLMPLISCLSLLKIHAHYQCVIEWIFNKSKFLRRFSNFLNSHEINIENFTLFFHLKFFKKPYSLFEFTILRGVPKKLILKWLHVFEIYFKETYFYLGIFWEGKLPKPVITFNSIPTSSMYFFSFHLLHISSHPFVISSWIKRSKITAKHIIWYLYAYWNVEIMKGKKWENGNQHYP